MSIFQEPMKGLFPHLMLESCVHFIEHFGKHSSSEIWWVVPFYLMFVCV